MVQLKKSLVKKGWPNKNALIDLQDVFSVAGENI